MLLSLSGALLVPGCADPPQSSPYPYDDDLIRLFYNNVDAFEALQDGKADKALLDTLGVLGAFPAGNSAPGNKVFAVWARDLFGPGYCVKGFAHVETVPAPLVNEIGPQFQECPPEEGRIYRRIADNWYLFYESYN